MGVYTDTLTNDTLLYLVAKNPVNRKRNDISESEIHHIKNIGRNSHRVIIGDTNGNDLILHLFYENNRWYLYMIDKMSSDCSA